MAGNISSATAQNTILGLEKQVLWQHGTPERIESDNGTNFRNNLIDTWAKEHGIEWSPVKINQISLDESGEHMGVCSEDGKVQVFGLYSAEEFHETFDCPIKICDTNSEGSANCEVNILQAIHIR
ncbi:hypothetical protein QYF61_019839 [Mycteria americana]|uniref:Vps41 beta-propeller domain-containing protein n=1 Tax=Mycteria americana TaxID=33587 RepID=A0AAN7S0C1_MYCAM|nr:hypothetical protein QYF61_019839 [Mycteria americana]